MSQTRVCTDTELRQTSRPQVGFSTLYINVNEYQGRSENVPDIRRVGVAVVVAIVVVDGGVVGGGVFVVAAVVVVGKSWKINKNSVNRGNILTRNNYDQLQIHKNVLFPNI